MLFLVSVDVCKIPCNETDRRHFLDPPTVRLEARRLGSSLASEIHFLLHLMLSALLSLSPAYVGISELLHYHASSLVL